MTRNEAKNKIVSTNVIKTFKVSSIARVKIIDNIYDDFENIIDIEINKLHHKIHKGFCDDKTQDKNYEIFDKISILENIKKNLNEKKEM